MTLFSPTLWLCITRFGILLKKDKSAKNHQLICKESSTQKFVTFHRNNRTIPNTTPLLHIPDETSKESPRYLKTREKRKNFINIIFLFIKLCISEMFCSLPLYLLYFCTNPAFWRWLSFPGSGSSSLVLDLAVIFWFCFCLCFQWFCHQQFLWWSHLSVVCNV